MKRTMYQAARHTPKRNVVSSSLAGGATLSARKILKMVFRVIFYQLKLCWNNGVSLRDKTRMSSCFL